jgi:hypothetical protein
MNGILIDEYGDFVVSNGSLSIGNVDEQIVEAVMISVPGEIKEIPMIGMNIRLMLSGNVDPMFPGKLKAQLKTQHLIAKKISYNETEINVEV